MDNPISEKTISGYAMATYLWVVFLATWGGIVNYIGKVRSGATTRFNVTELIGDIIVSGFVGVLTFWLCEAADFGELLTAVFVGVSGHMGARAMAKFEAYMAAKIGVTPPKEGGI